MSSGRSPQESLYGQNQGSRSFSGTTPPSSFVSPPGNDRVGENVPRQEFPVPKRSSGTTGRAAAHERKKTTRACDSCKLKKTRCSGTQPCVRCTKLFLPCNYKSSYRRGSPPPPLAAPATSIPEVRFGSIAAVPTQSVERGQFISPPEVPRDLLREPVRGTPMLSQLPSSRNSPERGATDFEGRYLGPTSGVTFLNRAWRQLKQDHVSTVPDSMANEGPQDISIFAFGDTPVDVDDHQTDRIQLPARKDADELVAIYFDFAMVTYRFLHKGTIASWLNDIYVTDTINLSDKLPQTIIAKVSVVFMVFAIVALHEENVLKWDIPSIKGSQSEFWFKAAQQIMSLQTGPPCLEMIQARMAQCLYLISTSRVNQCLYTLGTVMHLIMAAGLHRKRQKSTLKGSSFIELECQKRVFWSAYMLDRYLSVMLGRPKTIHDEDIDQDFPEEVNDEDMTIDGPRPSKESGECQLTASILHFQLSRLVGEISRQVYTIQPISETRRLEAAERLAYELENWKSNLPPIFTVVKAHSLVFPLRRQSHVMEMAYAHATIHANRSFLLSNFSDLGRRPQVPEAKVLLHVRKCVDAARTVVEQVNLLVDGPLSQAFWFTHYACFCAVMVLYVYTIQQTRLHRHQGGSPLNHHKGDENLLTLAECCQRHLAKATLKHSRSRRYSIILEELRQEVHRQILFSPEDDKLDRNTTNDSSGSGSRQSHMIEDGTAGRDTHDGFLASNTTLPGGPMNMDFINGMASPMQSFDNQDWNSVGWMQLESWTYANMGDLSDSSWPLMYHN